MSKKCMQMLGDLQKSPMISYETTPWASFFAQKLSVVPFRKKAHNYRIGLFYTRGLPRNTWVAAGAAVDACRTCMYAHVKKSTSTRTRISVALCAERRAVPCDALHSTTLQPAITRFNMHWRIYLVCCISGTWRGRFCRLCDRSGAVCVSHI